MPAILGQEQEEVQTDRQLSDENITDYWLDDIVEVKNNCDYKKVPNSIQVKGNLIKNITFWRNIGAPRYILSISCECCLMTKFVEEAIADLLHSDRIMEVPTPPLVVNALTVSVQPNGKKRLILDLRHVNKYLRKQKVKY